MKSRERALRILDYASLAYPSRWEVFIKTTGNSRMSDLFDVQLSLRDELERRIGR